MEPARPTEPSDSTHPTDTAGDGLALARDVLSRRRRAATAVVGAGMLHVAALLSLPMVTQRAIDQLLVGGRTDLVVWFALAFALLAVLQSVGGALRRYFAGVLMSKVGHDLRARLHAHVQRLSLSASERIGVGELMSRVSNDVAVVETFTGVAPFVLQATGMGVGGVVMTFAISPLLSGVVLALVVVVGLFGLRFARPLHGASLAVQQLGGRYTQYVEQQIGGIRVIKGMGLEEAHERRGTSLAATLRDGAVRLVDARAAFLAAFLAVPAVAILAVVGIGGTLAIAGRISAGELFAFLQYLGFLIAPVLVAAQLLGLWPQARAALGRISAVLETEPQIEDSPDCLPLPRGPGTVRLEDVWFGYVPGEPVLRGVTLDVPGGSSMAVVGGSGSGKTTLAALLSRFYDPWSGVISLDGVPLDRVRVRDLREAVATVFEDTVVFSTSIRDNLTLAQPHATPGDIAVAAEKAAVEPFVVPLPEQLDTHVGDRGSSLSGGQRQRLSVARALLRHPRVLVFDDATSALDPQTRRQVESGVWEMTRGTTVIAITNHHATAALCDRVVLLDEGRVVATGTHAQLRGLPEYRAALALGAPDQGVPA